MSDYKPKVRKDPYDPVYCVFCWDEIPVGATYHYVKSRSAGTRPFCMKCAKILKMVIDEKKVKA